MSGRGHLQRARRLLERPSSSKLAAHLKSQFCFGKISAAEVQVIAALAVGDHEDSPAELTALGRLGTAGRHPNNAHKELDALLRRDFPDVPAPVVFRIPARRVKHRADEDAVFESDHGLHSSAAWFHYLFEKKPIIFSRRFLGCDDGYENPAVVLERFWRTIPDDDGRKQQLASALRARPGISDDADIWRQAVPLIVHGDGVPVGKQSLNLVSWSGLLSAGLSTLDSKMVLSGLLSRARCPGASQAFWSALCWDLGALMAGTFPYRDCEGRAYTEGLEYERRGNAIAGGLFGVVWVVKGDMEWVQNTLGLEGASCVHVCPWCLANTVESADDAWASTWNVPPRPWNDIGPDAAWRPTTWQDPEAWLAAHGGRLSVAPLLQFPNVSVLNVAADVLHIFDLGVLHQVLGNVMWQLCFVPGYMAGDTPSARLDTVWGRIVEHYRGRGTRNQLGNLTLAMFCDPSAPRAEFPAFTTRVKAAETRALVPIVAAVFETVAQAHDETDAAILSLLQHLVGFYNVIEGEPYMMSRAAADAARVHVESAIAFYRQLSAKAFFEDPPVLRWKEVPKCHYALHVGLQASSGNPRFTWTYTDEDFMGYAKTICEHCTEGTPTHAVVLKMLQKWGFGVALRALR